MATLTIVQKLDLGFGFLVFWGLFFWLLILVIELKFLSKKILKEKFKNLRSPPVVLGSLPLLHWPWEGHFFSL